jgi:hypothetical protein
MAEEPIIVKLAGWIHTGLAFAREKLSLLLPSTKFLGLDITTLILILVSLIISYLIFKRGAIGLRAIPWLKFAFLAGAIFLVLKFL